MFQGIRFEEAGSPSPFLWFFRKPDWESWEGPGSRCSSKLGREGGSGRKSQSILISKELPRR